MCATLRNIIALFFTLSVTFTASAQVYNDVDKRIDMLLNRYENSCQECLNLRERLQEGEKISKGEAEAMVEKFVYVNGILKELEQDLNEAQKKRFEAINRWFSTGERPKAMDHKKFIAAETPIKTAQAAALQTLLLPEPGEYQYISDHKVRPDIYIVLTHSRQPYTYGIGVGALWEKWGGYVNYTSNFNRTKASYQCTEDGILENGSTFWPNGKTTERNLTITSGALYRLNDYLNVYGGVGYGQSQTLWQDIDGQWAEAGKGIRGICLESGLMIYVENLAVGIGLATLNFKTITPSLSIGIVF